MRALAAHPSQKTLGELLPSCSPLKFGSEVDDALHQLIAPGVEEREEGLVGDYDLELIEAQAYVAEASYHGRGGFKRLFDGYVGDSLARRAAK